MLSGTGRLVLSGLLALLSRASLGIAAEDPAAESPTVRCQAPVRFHGVTQLRYDLNYLVRPPKTIGRRGRRKLYATAGATVALYLLRDEIRQRVQGHRTPGRSRFLDDVRTMGKGAFAPGLALVAYGASFVTKNDREKETALLLLESAGTSAVAAYGGSFVLAADRPEEGDSVNFLDTSGHGVSLDAALAASVVVPLRRQYLQVRANDRKAMRFWKRSATVMLYGGAVLTGYQRLDRDEHWAPDVFLGLSAGFNLGRMLCDSHDEAKRKRGEWAVAPTPAGAAIAWRWTPD